MSEQVSQERVGASATILVTGFPGFIAGRLIEALARELPEAHFVMLVLPQMRFKAEGQLACIAAGVPGSIDRFEVLEGDITLPNLGLGRKGSAELAARVGVVWHLAAIYDLSVAAAAAFAVNAQGTANVLDFCEKCARFERLNYVSTCYVSGDRTGRILEDELDRGQSFKNHYEETKFWAEVDVQRRADTIPSVIFRPGIVVGDSRTGETGKFDGPYYLFRLIDRLPERAPMVNPGSGDAVVNLVPVDFVTDALTHLGHAPASPGTVYQVADPEPMRARDILALALRLMGRKPALTSLPGGLAQRALKLGALKRALDVPQESLVYFNHDARYDSTETQRALVNTDIRCPHLSDYLGTLIEYMREA